MTPSGAVIRDDVDGHATFQSAAMEQYGIHSNAEEMITAHRRSQDPALHRAAMIQPDADATQEAKDDLPGSAKKLGLSDGEQLLDATVRGNAIVGVVQDEQGNVYKTVGGWNDDYVAPKLTPEQAADKAALDSEKQIALEVDRLRVEMEGKLQDTISDMTTKMNEAIAKAREDAAKDAEKAAEKAQKESEKSDKKTEQKAGGAEGSRSGSEKKGETSGE